MPLGVAASFTFVFSALKLPSVSGSWSHPTGTSFDALLFRPATMAPIGLVVLLFQPLLLAHGGLTTLGANIFSMAIVGPFAVSVFFEASLGDLMTYVTTLAQLACAFPDPASGEIASLLFALQGAIGVGFLGYYLGVSVTREKSAGMLGSSNQHVDVLIGH